MSKRKGTKRTFWVRVKLPDETFHFLDATRYIGKELPFSNPIASCAMEVSPDVVAFSLIHFNKHSAKAMKENPVQFPTGAMARLMRKGAKLAGVLDTSKIVVGLDSHEEELPIKRGPDGELEIQAGGQLFELTRRPSNLDLYMVSPGTGRLLAVRFGGHFGPDGATESMGRAAGKVLRSLSGLGAFKALAGFTAVKLPEEPGKAWGGSATSSNLARDILVRLFDAERRELGVGTVRIELDMANADPATQRFLFHFEPQGELANVWTDAYAGTLSSALDRFFAATLEVEVENLVYAIVLGELTGDQALTLEKTLASVPPFDITPTQFRAVNPTNS